MKREMTRRDLRMGCGESLVGQVPLAFGTGAKPPTRGKVKPAKPKRGEDGR